MSMDKCKKACCLWISFVKFNLWQLRREVLGLQFQNCKWDYFSFEILLGWWLQNWCTLISLIIVKSRLLILKKKIHPQRTFPPSMFIDFLDLFHPPLLVYCIYVLVFSKQIPPSTFIPTSTTMKEMRVHLVFAS